MCLMYSVGYVRGLDITTCIVQSYDHQHGTDKLPIKTVVKLIVGQTWPNVLSPERLDRDIVATDESSSFTQKISIPK